MPNQKYQVVLGLGTNLGNKIDHLNKAVLMLENIGITIISISKIYQTPPWGFESEEDFYNLVLRAKTNYNPIQLLVEIKSIELLMGRPSKLKSEHYESRIIDIDIIDFNGQVIDYKDLKIPHPHLHKRSFVIYPLKDIMPNYCHPVTGSTIEELMAGISNETITVVNI